MSGPSIVEFINARLDEGEATAREWQAKLDADIPIPAALLGGIVDPAYVLADIAAKRRLLADLLAEKHSVCEDCWYTCAVAIEARDGGETCRDDAGDECDCGRDARVERRARLLAAPFAAHEQWNSDWSVSE